MTMLKITIQTDADFTPPGQRTARVIKTYRDGRQLRWYVSGKIYNRLPVNASTAELTTKWLNRTYTAGNGEELPEGSPGTTIVNDGRPV
jgi:hypothetical protein